MADTIIWVKAIATVLGFILGILVVDFLVGDFVLPELWLVTGVWLLLYRFFGWIQNKYIKIVIEIATSVSAGSSISLFTSIVPLWKLAQAPLLLLIGSVSICSMNAMAFLACTPVGGFIGALVWQLSLSTMAPLWLHGWFVALCALLCSLVFTCTPVVVALEGIPFPALGALLTMMSLSMLVPATGFATPALLLQASRSPGASHTAAVWAAISTALVVFHTLMMRLTATPGEEKQENIKLSAKLMPSSGDAEKGQGMNLPAKDSGISRLPALTHAFCNENADLSGFTENEVKLIMICRQDEEERNRIMWGGGLY
mmetsp:Transcript_46234/g.83577  ORF Transcript_46234/g.83577 Transcript_46234/m.83577 type:complete len:314 (-) Transcript_46234:82-1023(-)